MTEAARAFGVPAACRVRGCRSREVCRVTDLWSRLAEASSGLAYETSSDESSTIHVVILAAGQGTRMKSAPAQGAPSGRRGALIEHVLRTARLADASHNDAGRRPRGRRIRPGAAGGSSRLQFAVQEPQLGTAPRAAAGRTRCWPVGPARVVLLSGDVPLLTADDPAEPARRRTVARRPQPPSSPPQSSAPMATAASSASTAEIARIVEERDASPAERQIREINSGIYAFDLAPLFDALRGIAAAERPGRVLPDRPVAIYRRRKLPVKTLRGRRPAGNPRHQQPHRTGGSEQARETEQERRTDGRRASRSSTRPRPISTPTSRSAPTQSSIPGVVIEGHTRIGAACEIQAHVRIVDSEIGDQVTINNFCLIVGARVADGAVDRPVRPPAAGIGRRRGRQGRQLRGAEEDDARRRARRQPPRVPRRRDDRRQRQRRRRNHHLQLRRRTEARRRSSKTARSSAATRS